jgi:hypothetical protein
VVSKNSTCAIRWFPGTSLIAAMILSVVLSVLSACGGGTQSGTGSSYCSELQAVEARRADTALPPHDQVVTLRRLEELVPGDLHDALAIYRATAETIEAHPETILKAGGFGSGVDAALEQLGTESKRLCGVDPFDVSTAGGAPGPLTLTVTIAETPSPAQSLSAAAAEYDALAHSANARTSDLQAQISDAGSDLTRIQPLYQELADLRHQAAESLRAIVFPADAKAPAEELITALETEESILTSLAQSTSAELPTLQSQLTTAGRATTDAASVLRRALGLP